MSSVLPVNPFVERDSEDEADEWQYEQYMIAEAEMLQTPTPGRAVLSEYEIEEQRRGLEKYYREEGWRNVFADVMIFLFMLGFLGVIIIGILKQLAEI